MTKRRALALSCVLVCWTIASGCSRQGIHGTLLPNQPPSVELTQVPAPADTSGTYAYEVSWAGFDADGRIAFFEYAVDPPSRAPAETSWVKTTENRRTFVFRSDSLGGLGATRARGFHTVVVRCQDDQGARSPVVHASFTSTTLAPTVQIVLPVPLALLARAVPSVVRIEWRGNDPDGIGTNEPVSYRYKVLSSSSEFPALLALADPDSLRRAYAPNFAGWDSVAGNVRAATISGLTPGQSYLFVVVAVDQAGAYSPVFSADVNMLQLRADPSLLLGPPITVTAPSFSYTFPSGGIYSDPEFRLRVEIPADLPIQLGWSAKPAPGGFIRGYRWAVDLRRLDDETPRTDEQTDLSHWSRQTTDREIVLPPFSSAGFSTSHFFYLEAEDDLRQRSIAVIEFTAVRAIFDRDLLIVDDTWFTPDRAGTGGCVTSALGAWPSAAELDTFLYAAGGKNYRCYPTGSKSPVGLFAGYTYDTLGTHFLTKTGLNLQRLDRYRNIIWMADLTSAFTYNDLFNVPFRPRPLLYEWCSPSVSNPLAIWLQQGGRLWLLGGGGAMASLRPYDAAKSLNNVFSSTLGELGPGRMMHDNAHWKSEIRILRSIQAVRSPRAVGGWPGAPDYTSLPEILMEKNILTDPAPPLRTNNFYVGSYHAEHLFKPNSILERGPLDPPGTATMSVLDTLYHTAGGEAGSGWPVMTLYHGKDAPVFVFSGFPIWYFQRQQGIDLVDFVLGRVWGLQRRPVPR